MTATKQSVIGMLLVLLFGVSVAFTPTKQASALTIADLQAQVTALLAQLAVLQANLAGGQSSCSVLFSRDLTVGSQGEDVRALQVFLNTKGHVIASLGAGSRGNETTYFGTLTRSALARYQASAGIAPAVGYFGPLTRANVNAACTAPVVPSTPPPVTPPTAPPPSPELHGTDGSISDVTQLSSFSNEEVGEGQINVKVLGFEVEASNDGDIKLQSMRVSFDPSGSTGSTRLDRYVSRVTIMRGESVIGSARVDDFTKGNADLYSRTIVLDDPVIVRLRTTEKFYIAIDAARTIDSADISGDAWKVDVDSIRYADGSGVVTTDTTSGEINAMNVPINFVTFSQAANTKLKISLDTTSPEEGIVIVSGNNGERNVPLLKGKLKLEGTSDIVLDELPVTLVATGVTNASSIIGSLRLDLGDSSYTESVTAAGATATTTFDRLRFTLRAGRTVDFTILADINEFAGDFGEGDTIKAQITSTNRDYIDAENQSGDQLSDSTEKSGVTLGDEQELRESGIMLTLISSEAINTPGQNPNDDMATFRVRFKVKAIGDTIYVSSLANSTGASFLVDKAGESVLSGTSGVLANVTDVRLTSVGNYRIDEGDTETFELSVTAQLPDAGTSGQYRMSLTGIAWDTQDVAPLSETYTSQLSAFKTTYIGIN